MGKKPAEYNKEKGITKDWYLDNARKPLVHLGMRLGKQAAHDFIKALDMRMRGRNDILSEQYFSDPIVKAAQACMMFFKYLGQDPAFYEVNDPQHPVPIFCCWLNKDGRVVWTHNAMNNDVINQYAMIENVYLLLKKIGYGKVLRGLKKWGSLSREEREKLLMEKGKANQKYGNMSSRGKNVRSDKSKKNAPACRDTAGRDRSADAERGQVQEDA